MKVRHYANLSNGVFCECFARETVDAFTRIQSTALEQKLWSSVVHGAGPDLLMHLAMGVRCVVHDVSERERRTRAVHQGLPWLRGVCQLAWGEPLSTVRSRSGMNVTRYVERTWSELDSSTRSHLKYFGRWHTAGAPVCLEACW